ncbi:MAG: TfoX/Sxy family protein [Proteobacteria bacterium]|nr:TfoX/Sxy family protein [Pseudomonadota bacterium]
MASTKDYLDYVLGQLSELRELSYRPMMGEYVLYYQGKVVGGIYDNRLLLKATQSAMKLQADTGTTLSMAIPYDGAKEMLAADIDDIEFTGRLIRSIASDLPAPKAKKGKQ